MAVCRFLYSNLITAETMLAVSSLRPGQVTSAKKEGAGSATLNPSGAFSGPVDLLYTLEIDSIAGGAEVGQATFKWSKGAGAWDASGVLTSAVNILLEAGVYVNWITGSGADFVVGDRWTFFAFNPFNPGKMLDLDRDSRYRSAALASPNTITISLGSALEVKALALWDHNLTSAATITIKGHTSDSWGSPAFSEAVSWASGNILHYLAAAQTYRYWQIQITDTANPDGYIQIGELALFGSWLEPSANFGMGGDYSTAFIEAMERTTFGVQRSVFYNEQQSFPLSFPAMPDADRLLFEAMVAAITSRETGIKKPLWWNEDPADPSRTWLVDLEGGLGKKRTAGNSTHWEIGLRLEEVLKTIA